MPPPTATRQRIPASPEARALDRAADALRRIVEINGGIRRVHASVSDIQRSALNALIAARHAGPMAAGFGVVASEVSSLAKTLGQAMGNLRGLTDQAASANARVVKESRIQMLLCAAFVQREGSARTDAGHAAVLQAATEEAAKVTAGLRSAVDDSLRLSLLGATLTSSAQIEAAHSGQFREAFGLVARDLANSLHQVTSPLRTIAGMV